MHTVELLEQALATARELGYRIRQEWIDCEGGSGICEFKGQKWIFLDHSLDPSEQLEIVMQALDGAEEAAILKFPGELRRQIELRKSA